MAYNVIVYKTWHTLQLPTENLSHDSAFVVQLHWSFSLQSLQDGAPHLEDQEGIRIMTASHTPSLAMVRFMCQIAVANVPFWAHTLKRDERPMLPHKLGCYPAQRLS